MKEFTKEEAKEIQQRIGVANWDLNYYTFCELLGIGSNQSNYSLGLFKQLQELNRALSAYDADNFTKLLNYCLTKPTKTE